MTHDQDAAQLLRMIAASMEMNAKYPWWGLSASQRLAIKEWYASEHSFFALTTDSNPISRRRRSR